MTQLMSAEAMGRMECEPTVAFNEIVRCAFENTRLTGMLVLEAEDPVEQEPYLLIALVGALINHLAPEGRGELKLYTYDALGFGCAEIRGARPMIGLPPDLLADAGAVGVKLQLVSRPGSCSVLLSVPSAPMAQEAA